MVGLALFALFFGAGNLILPPALGYFAGAQWYLVALGFGLSAVGLPLLGIIAHARLQGTIYNFAEKISPAFSIVFSLIIYLISITLPAPRTAAVTHEIAIKPFFEVHPMFTSIVYFLLVFLFVIRRSQVVANIGKYLTPVILVLLIIIIFTTIFSEFVPVNVTVTKDPILTGFFEGYQTFDAIAALVVGGVIVVSVKSKKDIGLTEVKKVITTSAVLAGLGLLLVYGGLLYSGALVNGEFPETLSRTQLLSGITYLSLGSSAGIALALLVAVACFSTAVGIVTGTADFLSQQLQRRGVYPLTVSIACAIGIIMGAFSVDRIIEIAFPVLLVIYPLTIVLIFLNVLPERFRSKLIMRSTALVTILFSIPDALKQLNIFQTVENILLWIPFSDFGLGWVLPAAIAFLAAVVWQENKSHSSKKTAPENLQGQ